MRTWVALVAVGWARSARGATQCRHVVVVAVAAEGCLGLGHLASRALGALGAAVAPGIGAGWAGGAGPLGRWLVGVRAGRAEGTGGRLDAAAALQVAPRWAGGGGGLGGAARGAEGAGSRGDAQKGGGARGEGAIFDGAFAGWDVELEKVGARSCHVARQQRGVGVSAVRELQQAVVNDSWVTLLKSGPHLQGCWIQCKHLSRRASYISLLRLGPDA